MASLAQAGAILLGFIVLLVANFLSIGLKKIEDNWEVYRCNPLVMPLAGMLGRDPTANLGECIKMMQTDYMSVLMQPIDMNFSILTDIASSLTSKMSETMAFIDGLRDMIGSLTVGMFGAFSSILSGFALSMMAVRDIVSRLVATTFLLMYSITSLLNGGRSLWNGPPGKGVRALASLCFTPNSRIELSNGESMEIQKCEPGTVLKGGGIVRAIMELDNRTSDGEFLEELYEYGHGAVSGKHLVYDTTIENFTESMTYFGEEAAATWNVPVLYCLITTNHVIPSGGHIFHDWEDNNGSSSKSL